jgi:biopolymer transport protein ExbD
MAHGLLNLLDVMLLLLLLLLVAKIAGNISVKPIDIALPM